MSEQDERAARRAAQLRANLRRRKAQARGEGDGAAPPEEQVPPVTHAKD